MQYLRFAGDISQEGTYYLRRGTIAAHHQDVPVRRGFLTCLRLRAGCKVEDVRD